MSVNDKEEWLFDRQTISIIFIYLYHVRSKRVLHLQTLLSQPLSAFSALPSCPQTYCRTTCCHLAFVYASIANRLTFIVDTSQASSLCDLHLCLRIHMAYPVGIARHSVLPFARPQGKRNGFLGTHGPRPIRFTTPELGIGKGSVNQRPSHLPADRYDIYGNGSGRRGIH